MKTDGHPFKWRVLQRLCALQEKKRKQEIHENLIYYYSLTSILPLSAWIESCRMCVEMKFSLKWFQHMVSSLYCSHFLIAPKPRNECLSFGKQRKWRIKHLGQNPFNINFFHDAVSIIIQLSWKVAVHHCGSCNKLK